ncbi:MULTISPECIES: OmpA family protein [Chryseobacterium]|uniref:Outer membrane protein OmpA-like peptidoglycan-associated protein n=1 Tax=Chryseobacterium camelliae TaxID=1265445 RepID=A0ABU0TEG0_9FLAO|nr:MULTISPECIES: OmpA family protein [Chryseobacterium]MDT3406742.1 outer membrane protein OmpA-like peptidoglycan-associated protein [Pseudacidovorax intermedius]MDQ1095459.1 outer membrane protein OmpA-like peptidoglycan-associated protein [Chryseobacterium camelliae]MDQ1099399.1 outer membrane protein OmpA-like peptidoglycan-associated protein [Chryseobacterium sp. SORGH_AS_1048]MDR6086745.1 outer membrane protein OmpA-like peptidoglycan-associated protein [Chryseobacterium sp. SORGH_AS_0909
MSLNVIDLIKGQLGPALVSQAASQYGESESGISKAIGGFLPVVVGGLANHSDDPKVLDHLSDPASGSILSNLSGEASGHSALSDILSSIFGDKVNGLVNTIATYSGVSNNTSHSIMNVVAAAAVGAIAKYAADQNLDRSGITTLLNDQKNTVSSLMPAGLSLASLGMDNWNIRYKFDNDGDQIKTPHHEPKIEVTKSVSSEGTNPDRNTHDGGGSIWKWLLPLLLLIAAAYFIWKQCEKKETTVTTSVSDSGTVKTDTTTASSGASSINAAATSKTDEDIDLNGTALKGYKGGMEDRMIAFLKSGGYKNAKDDAALKDTWYDFDHVNFKLGTSDQLEAGSEGQLQNLVAILKAYPEAKIKIGGYTDKTGNEASNLKLSQARAVFIKDWLSKQGVSSQVIGAEGYGSKFAKVDASASDAERASDRRMSVRFAK